MNSILFFKEKLFIIFLFFYIIHIVNSTSFDYPYYLTLSNDNIFLIHYKGIDIYDSSFNKINEIIQFSGDEEMTEESFAKIELKYDNEYILSIIKDKIYIFNNEGKFLYKSEDKINNNQTIKNYALTSIGLYNDTYKYTIGYFDNNKYLNLHLYSYNITENNNSLLNIIHENRYYFTYTGYGTYSEYRYYTKENKELSCEYMSQYNSDSKQYNNYLTCFFFKDGYIGTTNYYIYNNKLSYNSNLFCVYSSSDYTHERRGTFIKSDINYDRTLAFIWFYFADYNKTYYTTYNISSNTIETQRLINNCSNENYKTKINKIYKNKDIAFSNEINDKKIKVFLYNNVENIGYKRSSFEINPSCENINGPAILYYNNNKNYYIYYCIKNCTDEFYKNDSYCLNLERKQRTKKNIIYIIISIIVIILLAISIFFLIKHFRKSKEEKFEKKWKESKKDEKIMNDFLTELIPDNN